LSWSQVFLTQLAPSAVEKGCKCEWNDLAERTHYMKIDAHQHFWDLDCNKYKWLTPSQKILYRNYLPDQLLHPLLRHQFSKTILIQAADNVKETEYLLDLYKKNDFIAGVVGWLDMESTDFEMKFKKMKEHKGFIGIRPMLQDLEDDQWILRPAVLKNIELLVNDDFPMDILIFPRHLQTIIELLEYFPNLRIVINHLAKPDIDREMNETWRRDMTKISTFKNVMCKLSGLITQTTMPFTEVDFKPFVYFVVDVFGAHSVMFGSDWPVCLLAGEYSDVYTTLVESLPKGLSGEEMNGIFGGNANDFYKLNLEK
jgi:L-fuconolactonase